jgi:hypothetical protein
MSNIASLPKKAAADPARAALRAALADLVEATNKAAKHSTAITNTLAATRAARKRVEGFKEMVTDAVAEGAAAIAAAAAEGEPPPAADRVRKVRADEETAQDELAALNLAVEQLRGASEDLKLAETRAAIEVERAICLVLEKPALELLARALDLRAELDAMVGPLAALFASDLGRVANSFGTISDVRSPALQDAHHNQMAAFYRKPEPHGAELWATARARLLADPFAPLDPLDALKSADGAAAS